MSPMFYLLVDVIALEFSETDYGEVMLYVGAPKFPGLDWLLDGGQVTSPAVHRGQ
jgi:hypothetical protein